MPNKNKYFNMKYHNLDLIIKKLSIFDEDYTIIKTIKVNQQRAVYLVIENLSKEIKIMKILTKINISSEQLEIYNFFKNNKHNNFCKIYDIINLDIFNVIIMEYIKGYTLYDFFKNNNNSRGDYYKIIFNLIHALQYLYKNNIVHGDIKPDNIIIKNNFIPVFIDYDLTKYVKDEIFINKIFGTRLFMAPELVNTHCFSHKCDIWALGISLLICILSNYVECSYKYCQDICSINSDNIRYKINIMLEPHIDDLHKYYGISFINIILNMLIVNKKDRLNATLLQNKVMQSRYYKIKDK